MFPVLNEKESQIINFVLQDLTNEQIADELCFSFACIKDNLSKIFKKYKVSSRVELAIKATKLGILQDIKNLNSNNLDGDQILINLVNTVKMEISDKDKIYDDKKSKQVKKDDRFQIIASEYSLRACKNNGGGKCRVR